MQQVRSVNSYHQCIFRIMARTDPTFWKIPVTGHSTSSRAG